MKVLLICLLIFLKMSAIDWTPEEKSFINSHKTLYVGGDVEWAGFDYIDTTGEYNGIAADYLKLIEKKTGMKVKLLFSERFSDLITMLYEHKIDLLPAVYYTQKRAEVMNFTEPYIGLQQYIFTRDDRGKLESIYDLQEEKLAILEGFGTVEWIEELFPSMSLLKANSIQEGLQQVYDNEAAAYIGDYQSTQRVLDSTFLPGIVVNKMVSQLHLIPVCMGVPKDRSYEPLLSIVDKVITSLSERELDMLRSKWFYKENIKLLNYDKFEKRWIGTHKTVTFSNDVNYLPFEDYDTKTKQYIGIVSDVLKLISKSAGIKFKHVESGSWSEALQKVKDREIDMLPFVGQTPEREQYLMFSKPYLKVRYAAYAKDSHKSIESVKEVLQEKIALIKDTYVTEVLTKKYPALNVIYVNDSHALIEAVLDDKADICIENEATMSYLLNQYSKDDVKYIGGVNVVYEGRIGIRSDWSKEAVDVFNKALDNISDEEFEKIYNKWLFAESEREKSISVYIVVILGLGAVVFLFIMWKYLLRKNV